MLLQKSKLMKELMELNIENHKLNKELKKWKSFSQKKSQSLKVLVQENDGVDQGGKASHDHSEQSLGNRKRGKR